MTTAVNNQAHLNALRVRLSHERERFNRATSHKEREMRAVWIAQIEKEIAGEERLLGSQGHEATEMSVDDLFAELS